MIVVFDTNVWLSELGLNSPAGAATKFFVKEKNAKVVLPEVVRLETEHNLRDKLTEFISKIENNYRQLLTVFGKLKEVVLPDNEAVEEKVRHVFGDLGVDLIEIPFTFESARSSFIKTIAGVPPSDRNRQQFKDGVLWADCVQLLEKDDVYLVTSDKAFYEDHDYSKGPAENLKAEVSSAKHILRLLPSLTELLEEIRTGISVDTTMLAGTFLCKNRESIDSMLVRNSFELGEIQHVEKTLFATEQSEALYIEFTIEYDCKDISDGAREDTRLILRGDGKYHTNSGTFTDLRNFGEELTFKLKDGSEKKVQNLVIHGAGLVIGHREVTHSVRYKLE
jgi:hypothetical protein